LTDSPLRLVAVDLGAESGRAVVGTFDGERLALEDVHRFPNVPVTLAGTLHWDFLRLFGDVIAGLRRAAAAGPVASVGVDTWGVDFGLLDARGRLLANPVHYRDRRTEGMPDLAFAVVPRDEIYAATGIQFMPINTLYQLFSMVRAGDPLLGQADRLLMMADLFHHFLAGSAVAEYTNASTSQCLDPITRDWARPLLERFDIPTGILPPVVAPGTILGPLRADVADETGLRGTRVVAPGTHDTASAVVGAPLDGPTTAFLSSGTWSLIGLEVPAPVISGVTLAANLTNEGGVGDTVRLLRNVVGLWLVQESRRALWPAGDAPSYEELTSLAETAPAFTAFIDPDDERFLRPGDLPARVRAFCAETGQPVPDDNGTLVRVLLESLALRYAVAVDELARASGHPVNAIQVVGGGSNNRLLCRLTASATGLPVRAGPVEATASGNLCVQAIAAGELASVAEARELVARSFPVTTYEPNGDWTEARARFADVVARRLPASSAT
jgi:rhamnulokinase